MPVSSNLIEQHVHAWEAKFGSGYRRHWPSRLFRHESLENALNILRSGVLRSRAHAGTSLARDVAPAEIINANHVAHDYARLYFRPKTPTQYRIEGIRKPTEVWNDRHAPVLYMFVFHSRSLLSRPGVHFSRGNMQTQGAAVLDGDGSFSELIFEKIYHEGSYPPDQADIKVWRCAEVLAESPLVLDDALEAIVCRSDAERKTLLYQLGAAAAGWSHKILIVTQPGYFNAEYAFVESVDLASDGIKVRFHPRVHAPVEAAVRLSVEQVDNVMNRRDFALQDLDLRNRWNFAFNATPGRYKIIIEMEGELAYKNVLEFDPNPF